VTGRPPAPPRADERGSIALEYVIVAPLFLIVFALIFAFARVEQLDGKLDSATRDAARQVTQLQDLDLGSARQAAQQTVEDDLGGGAGGCSSANVVVEVTAIRPDGTTETAAARPGDTITVVARCGYTLSDLGLPVPMPHMTAAAQFSAMVDPNRSVT
jgi:Flp pilus assembly protein TadG